MTRTPYYIVMGGYPQSPQSLVGYNGTDTQWRGKKVIVVASSRNPVALFRSRGEAIKAMKSSWGGLPWNQSYSIVPAKVIK